MHRMRVQVVEDHKSIRQGAAQLLDALVLGVLPGGDGLEVR
ncbi:hypothetical protein OPU71_17420 [Niveibacterium sp. 24ML]|nr:hypothetical protein [Niveibacterium sp. 24ML]MCX9157907.1 hypothetical protein [Niveibacterium sp. 24ML]